jgi:cytidylate kinase
MVVVAVDGPAEVGKSTVARAVAAQIGASYLDTGAFYRAATLAVIEAGVDPDDHAAVVEVTRGVRLDYAGGAMLLDDRDVSAACRSPEVTALVSAVSAIPAVREIVVQAQRDWVARHGGHAVVEGRDIGTVVFPDAPLKVFLVADPGVRARRRAGDREAKGHELGDIERGLVARDAADSTRSASPLAPASDAVMIDTSWLRVDEVSALVIGLLDEVSP